MATAEKYGHEEASLWLNNDEGLYREACRIVARYPENELDDYDMREAVKRFKEEFSETFEAKDIDLEEVDWEELVKEFHTN